MANTKKYKITKRAAEVLLLLEQAKGWHSGTTMAQYLGISRAAVSIHIINLRRAGCVIEAQTQRGYKFIAKPCIYDLGHLQGNLKTQILGRQDWAIFETIGSSNQEAVRLAMGGAATGTVVVAEHQSKGRGNKGHKWFSVPSSLYLSIIIRPQKQDFDVQALIHEVMYALVQTIEDISGLKAVPSPPNDVLLNDKKIAGILVERGFKGIELEYIVLGIGCNVNALREDFPPELIDKCTSLLAETGQSFDLNTFLLTLLLYLEQCMSK